MKPQLLVTETGFAIFHNNEEVLRWEAPPGVDVDRWRTKALSEVNWREGEGRPVYVWDAEAQGFVEKPTEE